MFGGALATGAALADALGGTAAATSFSLTTTIGLTGYGLYNAGKDLYNAQSPADVGAGFFELFTSLIGAYFGFRIGGGKQPTATGGDTPEILQDLQAEADVTGEPINKTTPGPLLDSDYLIGPDPESGETAEYLNINGSYSDAVAAAKSAQADNLILAQKVDYSFFSNNPSNPGYLSSSGGLIEPFTPQTPTSYAETFAEAFLSSIRRTSGGFGRVKSVLFVFQEGDSVVSTYGPVDVAAAPVQPPALPPSTPPVNPLGNTAPSPLGNTALDD